MLQMTEERKPWKIQLWILARQFGKPGLDPIGNMESW
jgi:hypothetical protein